MLHGDEVFIPTLLEDLQGHNLLKCKNNVRKRLHAYFNNHKGKKRGCFQNSTHNLSI